MTHTSSQSVLIITGMHRSGTSLTASLLQSAGVHLGDRLMGQDNGNIKGHFEDLDFVEFHRRVLNAQKLSKAGWTQENKLKVPNSYHDDAQNLLTTRQELALWGWKDPRTTLFLDFWQQLIPEAKYVFVYRSPWEVVDSLFRRGDPIFQEDPNLAVTQWCNYNQAILNFRQHHREQCLLIDITQVISNPHLMVDLIQQQWNLKLRSPNSLFEPTIFTANQDHDRQAIITQFFPQALDLYHQLNQQADLVNSTTVEPLVGFNYQSKVLQDWKNFHKYQSELSRLENLIEAMESSKFWRLRCKWFEWKRKLGIVEANAIYQAKSKPSIINQKFYD